MSSSALSSQVSCDVLWSIYTFNLVIVSKTKGQTRIFIIIILSFIYFYLHCPDTNIKGPILTVWNATLKQTQLKRYDRCGRLYGEVAIMTADFCPGTNLKKVGLKELHYQ